MSGTRINMAEVGGLQQALDRLPAEGGTVYVPAGTHHASGPVAKELAEGQHLFLVGDGRASVLQNENEEGGSLLRLTGVVGSWWPDLKITIRDLAFVGNYDSGDALVVDYANDTMIDGCLFLGHGGQAVYLKTQGTNVTIRDCWMRDCKRGVLAENLHHLTLHGNQTRSMADGQVQEEHLFLSWNCREVRVVNNHFAYGHSEGIILDGTAQHVIANNTIEGFTVGIDARGIGETEPRDRCRDIIVNGNYIHSPVGVRLSGECKGFSIAGNDFINNAEVAVRVEDGRGAGRHSITDNVIRKSVFDGEFVQSCAPEQGGIELGEAEDCIVSGNLLDELQPRPGISAGPGGGGHLITGNRIRMVEGEGLSVNAPNCLVKDNLVT